MVELVSGGVQLTSIYAALLGLMFIAITVRVGAYRGRSNILLGDAGDEQLVKLIRGQGNFVETVPIALLLIAFVELSGAADGWIHGLGIALLLGRISHYLQLTGSLTPIAFRAIGMVATLLVIAVAALWLLFQAF